MNKSNLVVVAGGTGAIGNAIADQLNQIGFSDIIKFGTKTAPAIDFNDENSILESVEYIQKKNKPISVFSMQQEYYTIIIQCQKKRLKTLNLNLPKRIF